MLGEYLPLGTPGQGNPIGVVVTEGAARWQPAMPDQSIYPRAAKDASISSAISKMLSKQSLLSFAISSAVMVKIIMLMQPGCTIPLPASITPSLLCGKIAAMHLI